MIDIKIYQTIPDYNIRGGVELKCSYPGIFKSIAAAAFQSIFYLKIHQNNILKNYF